VDAGESNMRISPIGLYMGGYRVRVSGGSYYVHIPVKLASQLGYRTVRAIMRVDARGCPEQDAHGVTLVFPATLTRVGSTYRLRIPSKYHHLIGKISDCAVVDVWLEPLLKP
jgi:hypothetical protein